MPQPLWVKLNPSRSRFFQPQVSRLDICLSKTNRPFLQGFACMQVTPGAGDSLQAEDCLTLNIWTKPQTGEKKKAVLVWIYGGGYSNGMLE